jgi:hypothetical protein
MRLSLGCPKCTPDFIPAGDEDGPVRCMNCKAVFIPGARSSRKRNASIDLDDSPREPDGSGGKSSRKKAAGMSDADGGRKAPPRPRDPVGAVPRYARSGWKMPTIPRWAVAGLAAAVAFVVVSYFVVGLFGRSWSNGPYQVTAAEIGQEYARSPKNADRKYGGKMVQITGTVVNIDPNFNSACILLDAGTGDGRAVECYVYGVNIDHVQTGQTITVVGQVERQKGSGSTIQLFNCQLVAGP